MRRILILIFTPAAGIGFWGVILVVVGVLLVVQVLRGGDLAPRDHYVLVSKDLVRYKCTLNRHQSSWADTTCSGTIRNNEASYRQYKVVITYRSNLDGRYYSTGPEGGDINAHPGQTTEWSLEVETRYKVRAVRIFYLTLGCPPGGQCFERGELRKPDGTPGPGAVP
jgi:hypothetical protein